jgi:cobalt-zinc-cadmium efflux system outer membrane protein
MPLGPGAAPIFALPALPSGMASSTASAIGSQSLSLEAALYGALTSNPDLVSLRQGNVPGNAASPEAVEVARRVPTTLNPTLWVDVRPIDLEPVPGGTGHGGRPLPTTYKQRDILMYFSLRQPIELGHQTRYRHAIARSALSQQHWTVVQAELLALVQTYRFFETAAYRREKLRVARGLAEFNDQLVGTLRRRLDAGQVTPDVVTLAEVESEATRQLAKAAKQEYARALTDLRNQLGTPEHAGTAEPLGEFLLPAFIPPVEDQALIDLALQNRPEIHAARAQLEVARAAVGLARADRIPTPVVGPTYERDQAGVQFVGFVFITPIPIVNNGAPLVRQREAEYRRACGALEQIQQRTVAQVEAAIANWNEANQLSRDTQGLTEKLKEKVASLERLFEAGQTDLTKLLQARQRLIQLENAELDAIWQATQAQADLLTALGAPTLIEALNRSGQPEGPLPALPASLLPDAPTAESPFRR